MISSSVASSFVLLAGSLACLACGCTSGRPVVPRIETVRSSEARLSIDLWYGTHQHFGDPGVPQRWVNILGNVSGPDRLSSLAYSLNGGAEFPLRIGPDGRRLLGEGDFNVEVDKDLLNVGRNWIVVTGVDRSYRQAVEVVALDYEAREWPLPYEIDWRSVNDVQDVAYIVDGFWTVDQTGIRTHPDDVGYDRVFAIGDMGWTDYEVKVPITLHGIDTSAYGSKISISPGLGINLRWLGHTDRPVRCSQPHCGWEPMGGSNWFDFGKKHLAINARPVARSSDLPRLIGMLPEVGKKYWMRARVETRTDGSLYRLKVWEDGVESEPSDWMIGQQTRSENLDRGSFLLVAHHVDVTFGDVCVAPVGKAAGVGSSRFRLTWRFPFLRFGPVCP